MLNVEHDGAVLFIELNHGKVNAFDLELLQSISQAFRSARPASSIVLTGAGRAFSAGVDLARIVERDEDGDVYTDAFLDALTECFLTVYGHPGPVVAAINGPAIAGGCVLAAACDRRIISRGPIGLVELAVGVPFPAAALEIMRALVGTRLLDLVLTARTLDPHAALDIGLVDAVAAPSELRSQARQAVLALAEVPPAVFAFTKRQLQLPTRERIEHGTDADRSMRELWHSPEVRGRLTDHLARLGSR